ncbi:MAG TPA: glycosyltransferase family 2 protein [Acholeplasmataceae bacterium]|nr:glycosyltransferase family 2 protein [Acholeplasmataceae bacterium]
MKRITIIVPCYNEEEVLDFFYEEVTKYLDPKYDFKLLFVNDGSKDKTLEVINNLRKKDDRIKYISFSRNFGKEAAMLAGLQGAKELNSDACIMLDADLQDPPSLIPEMLTLYEAGYKHIYAKHRTRVGEPKLKTFFALLFYKVYAMLTKDKNLSKGARDFCLMDKAVIDAFLSIKDYKRFTKGISSWVGFEKKCLEFDYVPRKAGKTKWSFLKLFKYAWMGIRQFSHVYKIIPKLLIVLAVGLLGFDTIYSILNDTFSYRILIYEVLFVFIFIALDAIMKMLYEIRDQGLNRPIYIIEDSNIND